MKKLNVLALVAALTVPALADDAIKIDSSTFGGLRARSIGPAVMGGRIAAIDATTEAPLTVYVGAASGGVWKSTDGGTTFKPVFDDYNQSIGAIAIDPANKETVWVGTGESWMRNSVSVGNGVYKTTDGGSTWKSVGLDDTEHVARIAVNPKSSDTVYVCATGHAWNANEQRGVFKTTDGGKTWKKVLYVDTNTGCSDVALDPQMPNVVYAGMWQFRRQPDFFSSGGPGSGFYKSTDGGEHWQKMTNGVPAGNLGRIAVAVSASRPSVLYALIEAKKSGLYRSDDLGEHWRFVNDSFNVVQRPFYFARVVVDPTDYNRVWKPGFMLTYSTDGGTSFTGSIMGGNSVHSDHHALWINPKDPNEMFLGTDGGLFQSRDRGLHWNFLNVLPVSQFYHVTYDMERPYNVYGGLQDNGSWTAPSMTPDGVSNRHWRNLGGGDGFSVVSDPNDSDIVYLESQGGRIVRVRRATGETREINPFAAAGESKLRFNWNTPIYASPTQKGVIYIGAQYLFRSKDRGDSWERISPDLTTNDQSRQKQLESGGLTVDNSSAENYTTIITINESPKNPNVIWVGTDDGNLQVTRDGGKTWTNVAPNAAGVPKGTWVSGVEAGHWDENTAYATFDGHRTGDMKTYVYKTTDGGKTWQPLATAEIKGFAQVVREDLVNPKLLFVGTEAGLYVSLDGGAGWAQFKENLSPVPVDDIAIHRRDGDAILATHGRGIYIIDDLAPLRALTADALNKDVAMLPSRPSPLTIMAGEARMEGDGEFAEGGVPEVATITYYLKKRHIVGESKIEVFDEGGKLISSLPAGKRKGINRVQWQMRMRPPRMPGGNSVIFSGGAFFGPRMPAGKYTVKYTKGSETYTQTIELVPDPRATYTAEDRALQQKTVHALYDMVERFTFLTERTINLRDQANERAAKLSGNDKTQLSALANKADAMVKTLVATREGGWLSGEEELRERLGMLYGGVNFYDGRPTDSQLNEMKVLSQELETKQAAFDAIVAKDLAAANKALNAKKLDAIKLMSQDEWEKKEPGSETPAATALLYRLF
ncbi:MAG TPA: glycosyl hydrolase [Thermoanaerobaculia bacterium]|nr:glycosyl hydrolase [Thermoanaerobaculia bacterium]